MIEVPAKKSEKQKGLGTRLRRLRKEKGFTQVELAQAIGSSQRMITYYETHDGVPGPHALLKLAEVFGVSPEEILGLKSNRRKVTQDSPDNVRLWRKLRQVERLPAAERRAIVRYVEALVERNALKRERAS